MKQSIKLGALNFIVNIKNILVSNDTSDTGQVRGAVLKECEHCKDFIYSVYEYSEGIHEIKHISYLEGIEKILRFAESCNYISINNYFDFSRVIENNGYFHLSEGYNPLGEEKYIIDLTYLDVKKLGGFLL